MEITLGQMEELIEKIKQAREKESELSRLKKSASDDLEALERQMIEILNSQGLNSYRGKLGTVSISHRTSVRKPMGDEATQAFFDYLKQKGLYDSMITVNSQTLNAFYKSQLEQAVERGEEDFAIPGITEVTMSETLSFRK